MGMMRIAWRFGQIQDSVSFVFLLLVVPMQ